MAIKLVGNKFQADVRSNGRRYRKTFDSYNEANAWEQYIKLNGQSPVEPEKVFKPTKKDKSKKVTLEEAFNACYEREWVDSKNELTVIGIITLIQDFFGKTTELHEITLEAIDKFLAYCRSKGNSNGTLNRKISIINKTLKFAYERGWLASVPKIKRFKEAEGRIRWYSQNEEKELLEWLEKRRPLAASLVKILFDTGARLGEALRIQWDDVSFSKRLLTLADRKAGNTTGMPMTQRVYEVLKELHKKDSKVKPFETLDNDKMSRYMKQARKALSFLTIEGSCWHACRHTFISRLVQKGVPIRTVQDLAGHKTIQMTMRYAHLSPANYTNAIAILESKE